MKCRGTSQVTDFDTDDSVSGGASIRWRAAVNIQYTNLAVGVAAQNAFLVRQCHIIEAGWGYAVRKVSLVE